MCGSLTDHDPSTRVFTLIKADRLARHDCRNGMLVNQLGLSIAAQQYTKVIKPSDHALQFDPVYEKYSHWDFGLTNMVQKCILQVLSIIRHLGMPLFSRVLFGRS